MKVILNCDLDNLGEYGDVIDVKPGYARNYLLPKNLAVKHTKHNLDVAEVKKVKYEKQRAIEKLSAEEQQKKLEGVELKIEKKAGENGVLFGSVNISDIEEELAKTGIEIDRKKFNLVEPIKKTGEYTCTIKLFKGIAADLKITVVPEGGELEVPTDAPEEEIKEEQSETEE